MRSWFPIRPCWGKRPSITYGLRGLNYYQIELTGRSATSIPGVYGGAVPNPLTILAELFAKLHDKNFRSPPGFYDQVAKVSNASAKRSMLCPGRKKIRESCRSARLFWLRKFHYRRTAWIRPTFELNGIWEATRGSAKTVIPSKAYAKFSTRLVPNQNPAKDSPNSWRSAFESFCRKRFIAS